MREPSIFRGIAVSLLRPVIGSNVEIDVIALNWFAHVRKQFAAAFKWLYKYFTSSSTVFIENSTFTVIIKLLHHWETPVQMSSKRTMLLFLLFCSFSILFHPLFSLEVAVSVFASTSSTSMSLNNSLKQSQKHHNLAFHHQMALRTQFLCNFQHFSVQSSHFIVTKTINLRGISNYSRQNYLRAKLVLRFVGRRNWNFDQVRVD